MAYQVLARKWRPSNFTQLVGQEHVSQSLIHALQHDRLHHAYLFTGTRGVGKTTIARILAKAINCENLQNFNPCGQCQVCLDFDQGRFMDLIEVDAASRTKVEDTRDLLDNVQYAPHQGRYKVYLIDEVHMLSGHSFNALLKTLEEPPEHVKFLLATTDPHKIPVTVLSRCLQFNLKRLQPSQIQQQLEHILQTEAIEYQDQALRLLSRAADGSLRDALSLLDQAIVYGSGMVNLDAVTGMLGTVAQQPVIDLMQALIAQDASSLLTTVAKLDELSPDYADLLQQLLRLLHRVAICQHNQIGFDSEFEQELLEQFAHQLSAEDIQLYYQIALIGSRDLALAPDPRSGFEMTMLRMLSFHPQRIDHSKPHTVQHKAQPQTPTAKPTSSVAEPAPVIKQTQPQTSPEMLSEQPDWQTLIKSLNLMGRTRELANNCVLDSLDQQQCRLLLDPSFQQVGTRSEENLKAALQDYFGRPIKLQIISQSTAKMTPAAEQQRSKENQQSNAVDSINSDPTIHHLKEHFAARILPGSIEPNAHHLAEKE